MRVAKFPVSPIAKVVRFAHDRFDNPPAPCRVLVKDGVPQVPLSQIPKVPVPPDPPKKKTHIRYTFRT